MSFSEQAQKVMSRIEEQLSLPIDLREGRLDNSQLLYVLNRVGEIKRQYDVSQLPKKSLRYATMTRIIIDSWPFGTNIGALIIDLESRYIKLEDQN